MQTQATTIHCNSSANITVGKHLIGNAFPIFIGCFARSLRPFLDPTANYGRASASLSFSWREILYRRPLEVTWREPHTPETPTCP